MGSKHLTDILFDTDSLTVDQIAELETFGANLMDLYRHKVRQMGLHLVDGNCVTK